MKKIRVEDAIGETLCHDMTAILADGFKGVKFPRGHVIREEDIPALLDMGKAHIFAWEPEANEVHEDDAARALVEVMCGEGVAYSEPSEGKFTILATNEGLFCINTDALIEINSVDDFTVACRKSHTAVYTGDKLAGARIVPLVTKQSNVDAAVKIARENAPVLSVKPFRRLKTGVIITGSEIYNGRIKDCFEEILCAEFLAFDLPYLGAIVCDDDTQMILDAIETHRKSGAELILLTGGMSVDPDDLTPGAIRATGAEIVTQGVPMQPGNMLTIAKLPDVTLVGVPGASMHSAVTSLNVFLPRILADVEITKADIARLGNGGLCLNCEVCEFPNCGFGV